MKSMEREDDYETLNRRAHEIAKKVLYNNNDNNKKNFLTVWD